MKIQRSTIAYGFLTPWVVKLIVFWLYPLIYALYMSFTRYRALGNTSEFIGLDNYTSISIDPLFWKALTNTLIYAFGAVPLATISAILLAVLLHSKLAKFPSFYRAGLFLPSVTSIIVITLIFTNLYAKDGYINALAGMIGLPQSEKGFLLETSTALFSVMLMDIWLSTGYYMMLFLAGLQSIPKDIYESAQLQGAGAFQVLRRITLPLLKPTILFVMVIATIKSLQIFVEMYTMTKGGPLNSTLTVVYLIFSNAFEKTDSMGYGAALAYVLFAIIAILSFLQMKVLGKKE
ncbi:MAG: carbohydrate ABC transporter permease [Candidatus Kapaibacteriota bacterium]